MRRRISLPRKCASTAFCADAPEATIAAMRATGNRSVLQRRIIVVFPIAIIDSKASACLLACRDERRAARLWRDDTRHGTLTAGRHGEADRNRHEILRDARGDAAGPGAYDRALRADPARDHGGIRRCLSRL